MPNNKRYNLKDIKNKENAHPYSRKAKQISRAINRNEKITARKTQPLAGKQAHKCDKFCWFKYALDEETKKLELDEIHELIESYLKRAFTEIDLKKPQSFKADIIKANHLAEREEYKTYGIEIPDLTDIATVKKLRLWDGDWNSISQLKVKKFLPPPSTTTITPSS